MQLDVHPMPADLREGMVCVMEERKAFVSGRREVLQCLLTSALRNPAAELGDQHRQAASVAIQRGVQFGYKRWLVLRHVTLQHTGMCINRNEELLGS